MLTLARLIIVPTLSRQIICISSNARACDELSSNVRPKLQGEEGTLDWPGDSFVGVNNIIVNDSINYTMAYKILVQKFPNTSLLTQIHWQYHVITFIHKWSS